MNWTRSPERAGLTRTRAVLAGAVLAALLAGLAAGRAGAQGTSAPPPGATLPATPPQATTAPGLSPDPAKAAPPLPAAKAPAVQATPAAAPAPESCATCHASMLRKRVVHPAVQADTCDTCHRPAAKPGKCKSRTASGWALTKEAPDLCYDCHERKDTAKQVHSAVRMGACLECHAAHASDLPALLKLPREQLCLSCHDLAALTAAPVKHAPVGEGRCLDCHDPHGSGIPKALRAQGKSLCLRCHEQSAPTGKGTPGPAFRLDLKKPVTHYPASEGDCGDCHLVGHGGENPKLLQKSPPALCYGCHDRQDSQKYVHGAVLTGDCTVCHDPHGSSTPKLLSRESQKDLCFQCHQDDVTGRAALHPPVADGKCLECHGAHGAPNRGNLVKGAGKQTCYGCHKPVDQGKVKHGALERYGCTGCHDPHGAANAGMLAKPVNALCVTCHPDTPDGRHAAVMVPGGHMVSGRLDPRRPGRQFSCASCHDPHGSDNPRLFYYGSDAMESCAGCHRDKTGKRPDLPLSTLLTRPGAPAAAAGDSQTRVGGAGAGGSGGAGDGPPR